MPIFRFGREPHASSLIKTLINFTEKKGNAHVVLGFVFSTNGLKDYSNKLVKQKFVQKQPQKVPFKKGVL